MRNFLKEKAACNNLDSPPRMLFSASNGRHVQEIDFSDKAL